MMATINANDGMPSPDKSMADACLYTVCFDVSVHYSINRQSGH